MNVVILTPDRVGSTLLQRVLTIHMIESNFNKPVINLHELTNGIISYFSQTYNETMLGKSDTGWGYWQSLPEVVEMLDSVDHYKTSRLAHYHIKKRKDSIDDQSKLYEYLNKNFYIISAQRKNVFEYALSWGIHATTSTLNVYSHEERLNKIGSIYKNKVTIPEQTFISYLNAYKDYVEWSRLYFNVNNFFIYEDHIKDIDSYISNLDFISEHKNWEDIFGINWHDWNKCHKLSSDLIFTDQLKLLENSTDNSNLPVLKKFYSNLPVAEQKFLNKNGIKYIKTYKHIEELIENKTLVTGIPIKLQTMAEKKLLIKNFNECLTWYNNWADINDYPTLEVDELIKLTRAELLNWYDVVSTTKLLSS